MADTPSALELSDEAFMKLMDEGDTSFDGTAPVSESLPEEPTELDNTEEVDENVEESPEDSPSDEGLAPDSEDLLEEPETEVNAEADTDAESEDDTNPDEDGGDVRDYQAELEQIFAPFKANGREMQVTTAEDVQTLMKKGANYDLKMDRIKPHLRTIKMLENNNVTDEQLSHLIDIHNNKPEAIAKLLSDNKLDPLEIDLTKATEYDPNTNLVDEREVTLATVLEDLKSKPGANDTMDIVGNQWDEASKQYAYDHSQEVIPLIEAHVTAGIYDKVMNRVARDRALGGLSGMSDIQAYKMTGDAMHREGAFNDPTPTVDTPSKKAGVDPTLKRRKQMAGSTKRAVPSKAKATPTNYLDLSDEEFTKLEADLGL